MPTLALALTLTLLCLPLLSNGEGCQPSNDDCATWYNWDKLQTCRPGHYFEPSSEGEVVDIVKAAKSELRPLKVVGAGHSFSSIALSCDERDGDLMSLDKLSSIVGRDGNDVTVQAGIRLYELNSQLEAMNLSLENLGATCEQSLAGATQTGTHGTGINIGSMSTQIVGLRLVDGNGDIIVANATHNGELFEAARVGLGAFGIITEITLRAEPLFKLSLQQLVVPLAYIFENLSELVAKYERFQWYWLPYDEKHAVMILRERTDAPITGCWDAFLGSFLGEPRQFFVDDGRVGVTMNAPLQNRSCVDVSYKALCGSRQHYASRNLYTEMEMFVPVEISSAAVKAFRSGAESRLRRFHNASVPLFTGVRYVRGDDITLSPQAGNRTNAVISMILMGTSKTQTAPLSQTTMFDKALEDLTSGQFSGRPHWGKRNWATAADIRNAYGDAAVADFVRLSKLHDPHGLFRNAYLVDRLDFNL